MENEKRRQCLSRKATAAVPDCAERQAWGLSRAMRFMIVNSARTRCPKMASEPGFASVNSRAEYSVVNAGGFVGYRTETGGRGFCYEPGGSHEFERHNAIACADQVLPAQTREEIRSAWGGMVPTELCRPRPRRGRITPRAHLAQLRNARADSCRLPGSARRGMPGLWGMRARAGIGHWAALEWASGEIARAGTGISLISMFTPLARAC